MDRFIDLLGIEDPRSRGGVFLHSGEHDLLPKIHSQDGSQRLLVGDERTIVVGIGFFPNIPGRMFEQAGNGSMSHEDGSDGFEGKIIVYQLIVDPLDLNVTTREDGSSLLMGASDVPYHTTIWCEFRCFQKKPFDDGRGYRRDLVKGGTPLVFDRLPLGFNLYEPSSIGRLHMGSDECLLVGIFMLFE